MEAPAITKHLPKKAGQHFEWQQLPKIGITF